MLLRLIDTERIPKWAETSRHKLLRPPPRPLYIGPAIAEIFGLLSSPGTGAVWRPEQVNRGGPVKLYSGFRQAGRLFLLGFRQVYFTS